MDEGTVPIPQVCLERQQNLFPVSGSDENASAVCSS